MSAIPTIKVEFSKPGPIHLVPYIHEPFIRLMDYLYPTLVSNSTVRKGKGYSAFLCLDDEKPQFIGSFTGLCLASVRKNPFFKDDDQWFLRALLLGMSADDLKDHRSRCAAENYGTLRLWQKLGLGAKKTTRGDYISTGADEASTAELIKAIECAKEGYADLRASADKRMANLDPNAIAQCMPNAKLLLKDAFSGNAVLTKD